MKKTNAINKTIKKGAMLKEIKRIAVIVLYKFLCLPLINRLVSDKFFIKIQYLVYTGQRLDLENVKTFNQKIQWLKLYYRLQCLSSLTDKLAVRQFVSQRIGEQYLVPLLAVFANPKQIDWQLLPQQFVLKATHDSGSVIVCKDKSKLDSKKAVAKLSKGFRRNYYYKHREWAYKSIKPRIIAEQLLSPESQGLRDYKFFCFDGKVHYIQVDYDRDTNHTRAIYDLQWNKLQLGIHYPIAQFSQPMPAQLQQMIELSQRLAKGFVHVRVDLYNVDGKIYFGEMTFNHGAGYERFTSVEYELEFGKLIDLSKAKAQNNNQQTSRAINKQNNKQNNKQ